MINTLLDTVRNWFRKKTPAHCFQCGLPPGREFMITTEEAILHPHQCSWCKSILYVPGPMFSCKGCAEGGIKLPAA